MPLAEELREAIKSAPNLPMADTRMFTKLDRLIRGVVIVGGKVLSVEPFGDGVQCPFLNLRIFNLHR